MKQIRILIGWLFVSLLVACTPTNEPVSVTRPIEATAILPATPTPLPTLSATQGWITFQNDYFQISHPADAILATEGDCLQIYYKAGYVTVSIPPPGGEAPLCDPTQLEGYDLAEIKGQIRIGDIPYLTSGNELYEPETANWAGEALGVNIDENATLITYGTAQNQGYTQEEYEASKVVLMEIINTYQRLETAVSVPTSPPPTPVQETAVPQPTQLAVCATGFEAEAFSAPIGPLRVSYSSGNTAGVWREEWNMVQLFPLPADATNALITADSEHVAFSRHPDDDTTEIWVMDADGNARRLAAASKSAYLQNQPDGVIDAVLSYHWIGNTHDLSYAWIPNWVPTLNSLNPPLHGTITVVTAETGNPRVVIPAGEVNDYDYAPNGSQLAAVTANEVRLISTADGSIQHLIPLSSSTPANVRYSPNGSYLTITTHDNITVINPTTGSSQNNILTYPPFGTGGYNYWPQVAWLPNDTEFYTILPNSAPVHLPDAAFTVWQVNPIEGAATSLNSFTGYSLNASFSPNKQYLAFSAPNADNTSTLYLANILTGETVAYDTGYLLEFRGWVPESNQFLYWFDESSQALLGQPCTPPIQQDTIKPGENVTWIDTERFLLLQLVSGDEVNGEWEIRLRSLDGDDTLVTTITGPYPTFTFSFAP